jgi:hypothetical protein
LRIAIVLFELIPAPLDLPVGELYDLIELDGAEGGFADEFDQVVTADVTVRPEVDDIAVAGMVVLIGTVCLVDPVRVVEMKWESGRELVQGLQVGPE